MNDSKKLPEDDGEIIGQLTNGGMSRRKGEEALFKVYVYFIREGKRKYHLSEDESFDAYSDTILSAIEKITNGSFERASSLKTYLYKIFQNKCVDLLRKKTTNKNKVHQTVSITDMLLHESDETKSVLQKLADEADQALLKQRLAMLGDSCHQLLRLSAEGISDKEIADMMEYKTADVVKTSRLRCLEKLRRLYNQT
jgi:RNA polymerase sigma-70 factor (ECF subfamily)